MPNDPYIYRVALRMCHVACIQVSPACLTAFLISRKSPGQTVSLSEVLFETIF